MRNNFHLLVSMILILTSVNFADAGDGYKLWLKYDLVADSGLLNEYKNQIYGYIVNKESATIQVAEDELQTGLSGLLGALIPEVTDLNEDGIILAGTSNNFPFLKKVDLNGRLMKAGNEGFVISNEKIDGKQVIIITDNNDIGVLYGVFHILR